MDPDLIGYLASGLVLLTFTAKSMLTLRIVAILSNFAFICYGSIGSIIPVLCLDLILLPLNVTRLVPLLPYCEHARASFWHTRSHGLGAHDGGLSTPERRCIGGPE